MYITFIDIIKHLEVCNIMFYLMQTTKRIFFPRLDIATVAASATSRSTHAVLVESMGGVFETFHAQHTSFVHAALPAGIRGFSVFEESSANGRMFVCVVYLLQDLFWITFADKHLQRTEEYLKRNII